jgi:hypothetical protein
MWLAILLLGAHTGLMGTVGQVPISGTVRTAAGTPLAGVRVFCARDRYTETDDQGRFSLPNRGEVIFLQHIGYRPLVLISSKLADALDIVMEDAGTAEFQVPSCEMSDTNMRFTFGRFSLAVPKHSRVRKGRDIDYTSFAIGWASSGKESFLAGIYGPIAASGFPFDRWITSSYEFSSRSWRNGDSDWVDIRGRSQDGLWRHVGTYGFSISYEKASSDGAAFFDRIIDSACFRN